MWSMELETSTSFSASSSLIHHPILLISFSRSSGPLSLTWVIAIALEMLSQLCPPSL